MTANDSYERSITLPRSGRKMVIREADVLAGIQRGSLAQRFISKPHKEDSVQAVLVSLYVPLACCSSGDVPTPEEFLAMKDVDSNMWVETASEINPHWFAWMKQAVKDMDAEAKKEVKKKERRRHVKSPRA